MKSTPRIRFPEPEDADALVEAVRESLADLTPWMTWASVDYHQHQALDWIEKQQTARLAGIEYNFVIVDVADRFLGTCGVNQINVEHGFANLGYWVRSSATGSGIAVEAVRRLAEWVFLNTDLERLEIVVAVGNRRSERVAEKSGARREGILRSRLQVRGVRQDATMFSLVRGEDGR